MFEISKRFCVSLNKSFLFTVNFKVIVSAGVLDELHPYLKLKSKITSFFSVFRSNMLIAASWCHLVYATTCMHEGAVCWISYLLVFVMLMYDR